MKVNLYFLRGTMSRKCSRWAFNAMATIGAFALLTLILMLFMYKEKFQYPEQWKRKIFRPFSEGTKPDVVNLEFYNLSWPIHQKIRFKCVSTRTRPSVQVCLYPAEMDGYISRDLKATGVWEPDITDLLMEVLNSEPTSVFLDIGSNLGYFSLLAAKSGHLVVSVEPDLDHVLRLHQAIELDGDLKGRILVLRNAMADVRVHATVRKSGHNQGDTQIEMEVKECQGSCPPVVKTIVLNDLTYLVHDLTLMSAKVDRQWDKATPAETLQGRLRYFSVQRAASEELLSPLDFLSLYGDPSKVMMKVDTQGFEHRIFDNPDFFFDRNHVTHVFMEWGTMVRSHPLFNKTGEPASDRTFLGQRDLDPENDGYKVEVMIRFLSERGFRPYSTTRPRLGEALNPRKWHTWPHDIVWCHDSQTFFMAKMGIRNLLGQ